MATYKQWKAKYPERKRLMYICGKEQFLVHAVVEAEIESRKASMHVVRLDAVNDFNSLADALCQIETMGRVIVLSNCDKLKSWDFVLSWTARSDLVDIHLIVVSGESNPETKKDRFRPFVEKGRFVRCGLLSSIDEYVRSSIDITTEGMLYLKECVGSNLQKLSNDLDKLKIVCGNRLVTKRDIESCVISAPDLHFVERLFLGDKYGAFLSLLNVQSGDVARILGFIEYRMRQVCTLYFVKGKKLSYKEYAEILHLPVVFVKEFIKANENIDLVKLKNRLYLVDKVKRLKSERFGRTYLAWLVGTW